MTTRNPRRQIVFRNRQPLLHDTAPVWVHICCGCQTGWTFITGRHAITHAVAHITGRPGPCIPIADGLSVPNRLHSGA